LERPSGLTDEVEAELGILLGDGFACFAWGIADSKLLGFDRSKQQNKAREQLHRDDNVGQKGRGSLCPWAVPSSFII
jgi:hypothetical protein